MNASSDRCIAGKSVLRHDLVALKRALGNLIDNGLRYGERIEISATVDGAGVLLLIHDHGPGLPESSHEEIFEPYVRLAHGRDTHREGSGLGLGIARGILREHGGDVALMNKSGGGLTAKVRLTLAAAPSLSRDRSTVETATTSSPS